MLGSTKHAQSSRRSGQLQIGEMVAVLVIFFFLVGFAALFFTRFFGDAAREEAVEQRALDLAETAKLLSGLPELHCSQRGDEEISCIDLFKAMIIAQKTQTGTREEQRHYGSFFPNYHVELKCVYPTPCTDMGIDSFVLIQGPPSAQREEPFIFPVVIYHPTNRAYAYGLLTLWQVSDV